MSEMIEAMARGINATAYAEHEAEWAEKEWRRFLPASTAAARAMCAHFGLDAAELRYAVIIIDDSAPHTLKKSTALLRNLATLMETPDAE